jgi:hypothetical protein
MDAAFLEQLTAVLKTSVGRWEALIDTIPLALLERAPELGEWSALHCLQHMLDTEEWVFPARVQAILDGRDFAAFDPDTQGRTGNITQSPAELAAQFATRRAESLAMLARLTPNDLHRTAQHAELGPVTMGELLNEWGGHDLMHIVQAEQAMMQPFIMGSGPWRHYFHAHDVGDS